VLRGIAAFEVEGASPAVIELAPLSDGLAVRTWARAEAPVTDVAPLWAALPSKAVLRFALPRLEGAPLWGLRPDVTGAPTSGAIGPPPWFWQAVPSAAFGWYPRRGDAAPTRWLTIVPWGPAIEQAWRAHELPAPGFVPNLARGLFFARRGGLLAVGTDPELVGNVDGRAPAGSPVADVGEAAIDGRALREVLEDWAARARGRRGDESESAMAASLAALLEGATLRGARAGAVNRFELLLKVAGRGQGADPALVDEWLRSTRLRNSLVAPRTLAPGEADRPLTLGVRSSRPDDLLRAFQPTERLSISRVAPDRFRVRVLPGTPPPGAGGKGAPRPLADGRVSAVIQTAAREIVGSIVDPAEQARAIIAWVHREMTYEVTPAGIDDITLLSRKRGDCTEYSQLTISLLRAVGIPARMRSGFMLADRSLVAHAWIDFHDGVGWREADPTAGRATVDARYVDASVVDVLSLLSLGQIEVTSLE
jgi:hypothetical protein